MRRKGVIFALLLGVWSGTQAVRSASFAAGNDAYVKGNYPVAIQHYTDALKEGQSVALYDNLASAYSRVGEIGLAVWSYERALTLSPRNPEARANLLSIRTLAQLEAPKTSFIDAFSSLLCIHTWCWLGAIAFWGIVFIIGHRFLTHKRCSWPWRFGMTLSGFLFVCSLTVLVHSWDSFHCGVIVAKTAPLKLSPTPNSSTIASLKSGEIATIQKPSHSHFLLQLPNGKTGWVEEGQLKLIYDR